MISGHIYKYTFPNGKEYVGQSTLPVGKRFNNTYGGCSAVLAAFNKYGKDSVKISVLHKDVPYQTTLDALETSEILLNNTMVPNGYNLTEGGSGGRKSAKTIENMKVAQRIAGPKRSAKISASKMGHSVADEVRKRISKTLTGRKNGPCSEEKKRKVSEGNIAFRKKNWHKVKGISRYNPAFPWMPSNSDILWLKRNPVCWG